MVVELYADPGATASGEQKLKLEELLAYLAAQEDLTLTPMESLLARTESIGDPALPAAEQVAILHWLGTAFSHWENSFGLEEPLATQLRRLKPLAAILAITEPDFLTPGQHPLHRLLDSLHLAAIGWQSSLGRVGQATAKQLVQAVDAALATLEPGDSGEPDSRTRLEELCSRVAAAADRDVARADRTTRRMIETAQGHIKTAEAKRQAAAMINAALEKYSAPGAIGEFLKGPWYESAQLLLLKFGTDSEQWRHMSATTDTLLDSLQVSETEEAGRRQHLFEMVTQLPRDLKRWLLSLQHDSEAVGDAMGMVEFAHLRILRKQPLELEQIDLLPVDEAGNSEAAKDELQGLEVGQWFSIDSGDGEPVRARLALRLDTEGQLLFANQAGLKALQQGFEEFATLLREGKVTELASGASFSLSLAYVAGIKTLHDLDTLQGEAALQARRDEEERKQRELERVEREQAAEEARRRELQEAKQRQLAREEAERLQKEQIEAEKQQLEDQEAALLQHEWDEAQRVQRERMEAEQAPTPPSNIEAVTTATDSSSTAAIAAARSPQQNQFELPMGAWLGFHDGDTPLLAKLAVHDREQDNYIFVNRSGIKMRELNRAELLALVEKGLVEILESRSHFRDEVTRVKTQS